MFSFLFIALKMLEVEIFLCMHSVLYIFIFIFILLMCRRCCLPESHAHKGIALRSRFTGSQGTGNMSNMRQYFNFNSVNKKMDDWFHVPAKLSVCQLHWKVEYWWVQIKGEIRNDVHKRKCTFTIDYKPLLIRVNGTQKRVRATHVTQCLLVSLRR